MKIKRAFTLIEVLVVVAVLAIVAIFVVPSFLGAGHTADLNGTTQQVVASLRGAQSDSAGEVSNAAWGVYFSNATTTAPFYAVFTGTSYATGTVQSVHRLPATVGFVSSTLPVGSSVSVTFSPVSGVASASTTIQLYVLSQPSLSSTITIANAGAIAYATPTTPASSLGSGGSGSGGASTTQYLYIGDFTNSRVQVWSLSGTYISKFSMHTSNGYPADVAISPSGYIYVPSMTFNHGIQIFNASGTYVSSFGSSGSGNGQFSLSSDDVAIGSNGNLYITDGAGDAQYSNHRVQILNASGTYISQFGTDGSGPGQFDDGSPAGIALSPTNGDFYVVTGNTNNNDDRVEIFNASGTYLSQFGSAGSGNGEFNNPYSIAIDANGNVYVTDENDGRVEKFNASGTYLYQILPHDPSGWFSSGIAVDASGNVYILDSNNNVIEKFDDNGNWLATLGAGYGTGNGELGDSVLGMTIH